VKTDLQSYEQGYQAAQRQFIDRTELAREILLAYIAAGRRPETPTTLTEMSVAEADALIRALKAE